MYSKNFKFLKLLTLTNPSWVMLYFSGKFKNNYRN